MDDRREIKLGWLALGSALTFLFRHDHALYIGGSVLSMLVLTHGKEGVPVLIRKILIYGLSTTVMLLPFLLFVQVQTGIVSYVRTLLSKLAGMPHSRC